MTTEGSPSKKAAASVLAASTSKPETLQVRSLSLRFVLIVPFVIQILTTVGVVGWLSYRNGQQAIHDLSTQLRTEVSVRIQQHLNSYLGVPQLITQINTDAARLGQLSGNRTAGLERHFWQQMQRFKTVQSIYLGNEAGKLVLVKRETPELLTVSLVEQPPRRVTYGLDPRGDRTRLPQPELDYDPRTRPWYQAAIRARKPIWSEIYPFSHGELGITASQPFYDRAGRFLGVMASDLVLTQIGEFLQGLQISPSGKAFILERSGLLVASSTPEKPFVMDVANPIAQRLPATDSKEPLIRATTEYLNQQFGNLNKIDRPQQLDFWLGGKQQFVQILPYHDAQGLDWLVVVVVPEDDFMDRIHGNTMTTIQLCFLALAIAVFVGLLTSHWIARPILQLSHAAAAFARGEWQQTVPVERGDEVGILARSFQQMAEQLQQFIGDLESRVEERTIELKREREKSEQLLLNILPKAIAEKLKQNHHAIAESFDNVTIMFADIVEFTDLAASMPPIELVDLLNQIFSSFDQLTEKYHLEKIKTIGDAYMVVGGLPVPREDHAEAIANMALEMQQEITRFSHRYRPLFQLRIGINTGSVVAGVIGLSKMIYDLWGDTVNVASRMESQGEPGKIQVTAACYECLKDRYVFEQRGAIAVKGKGEMITYWLLGKNENSAI